MPKFSMVLFHPPTKYPDRPWDEDPDVAAWLGTSRRVCEAYSVQLAGLGLQGRHSLLKLRPTADLDDLVGRPNLAEGGSVQATVNVDRFEGFEFGHVQVPLGVAALSPSERGELVLETVHALVVALGDYRGWDAAELAPVREAVLAERCEFVWEGPWKFAPGRKRQARVVHRLADDGFGRVTLEVRDAAAGLGSDIIDVGEVVEVGPALSFTTAEGFKRSARTLRWSGKDTVELVPYSGIFGDDRGVLRWEASGAAVAGPRPPEPSTPPPPLATLVLGGDLSGWVSARVTGDSVRGAEDAPAEIRPGGGGPTNGMPGDYLAALRDALDGLRSEAWQRWWAASGKRVLEIEQNYAPRVAGPSIRRIAVGARAVIGRPMPTVVAAEDRVQLALDDVTELMTAVRVRFGLGPLPWLPSRDELAEMSSEAASFIDAKQAARAQQDADLETSFADALTFLKGLDPDSGDITRLQEQPEVAARARDILKSLGLYRDDAIPPDPSV